MITLRRRFFGALLVAALVSGALAAPAVGTENETNAGFETVLRGTNDFREANGLDRLVHDPRVSAVAQAWAEKMAADYAADPNPDRNAALKKAFRHNPNTSSQIPAGAESVGENIAVNGGAAEPYKKLLTQWVNSLPHKENMLRTRWTHLGVGTYQDASGLTWGVQVFADYGSPEAIPDPVDAVVDLDLISYSGTVACVVLVKEPSKSEFFRQCGTRPGNQYTFSDVPPGSYSARLLNSGGGVLYSGSLSGVGTVASSVGGTTTAPGWTSVRLAGSGRYGTAVAVSQAAFPKPVDTVFVVTGENFPDALAAGPAAAKLGGPLLLVQHNAVPDIVVAELKRLSPREIVVLGGPGVINSATLTKLGTLAGSGGATRVYGESRYATAANIATRFFAAGSTSTVFLATGLNYPDALSGGPVSGMLGAPLLLSTTNTVPPETLSAIKKLGATKVVLLGGTGVLSNSLESQIRNAVGTVTVTRYSGSSRFSTSAAIVANSFKPATTSIAYVTVGNNFPDALAGSAAAAAQGAPILLSEKTCMPSATYQALKNLGVTKVVLLGGTGVIDSAAPTKKCAY